MTPGETDPRRESSKERTGRIRLDYYKRADGLSRAKGWLSAAAALAAVVWLSGLGLDVSQWGTRAERSKALANHGVLARAHASWDAECEACHVPFTPIDGSAWTARYVADPRAGDGRCRSCHAEVPDHHADEPPGHAASCASCHPDHRGREASLVAVANRNCIRCHASLGGHALPGHEPTTVAESITGFISGRAIHPEFAALREETPVDPGRVKFDHALHMTRGLPSQAEGVTLKTVADLPPEDRPRYRTPGEGDDQGVQLRCDSCHRPEGGRRPGLGALMKPVRYEADCRACHPLTFADDLPPVRHGLSLSEVDETLRQTFSAAYLKDHPEFDAARSVPRPVPGHEERPEVRSARRAIGKKVEKAERVLFGEKRCGECHHYETPDGDEVPALPAWDPDETVRVAAPGVKGVWFPRASFDHSPHAAVGCRTCHSRAYPDDPRASRSNADVMLPGIDVCRTCHAPREKVDDEVTGGAGFGCVECHRYHGGPPTTRIAPLARDATIEDGLRQFLLGVPVSEEVSPLIPRRPQLS